MKKVMLRSESDIKTALEVFGFDNKTTITKLVSDYPCVLIGCFHPDNYFGPGYSFICVSLNDFLPY